MASKMYCNIVHNWLQVRGLSFGDFDSAEAFAEAYADEGFGIAGNDDGFEYDTLVEIYDYWQNND